MKNLTGVLVFTLLLVGGICQSSDTIKISTVPQSSPDTTTPSTTKADTTTVSTTSTPVPTTTSSLAPTTSSPAPTTTTSKPPTTSPVPSTTEPSSTTTNVPITTTIQPPTANITKWNVTDGNITCIRAELSLRFKIPVKDKFDYVILTQEANTDKSTCNDTNGNQELSLVAPEYQIKMTLEKDSKMVYMKEITFVYNLESDVTGNVSNNSKLFEVNAGNSYLCNSGDVDLENVTMEITHIRIQAFIEGNKDFGTVEECEADNKVNDLIPIVVGCALLALVVIVLIAYFVGRRRSRQKGYQSV